MNKIAIVIFFTATANTHVNATCSAVAAMLKAEHPGFFTHYERFLALDLETLTAKRIPTWQDFEELRSIQKGIRLYRSLSVFTDKDRKSLDGILSGLRDEASSNPVLKALLEKRTVPADTDYKPTEYDLKRLYQELLQEVFDDFPESLHLKKFELAVDHRVERINNDARKIVSDLTKKVEALHHTSGYKDKAAFMKAVEEKEDSMLTELVKMLEEQDFDLVVQRPPSARWWLPKVGFQNQFVTGSSRGFYAPDKRNPIEAAYIDMDPSEYAELDDELKPIYGTFAPKPGSSLRYNGAWYGGEVYVLKPEAVLDRLLLNFSDSNVRRGTNDPVYAEWRDTRHLGEKPLYPKRSTPTSWDHTWLPWSMRYLLAPIFYRMFKELELFASSQEPAVLPLEMDWTNSLGGYSEIIIFGRLTLDDVKQFQYKETPPDGEFAAALKSKGIEVIKREIE